MPFKIYNSLTLQLTDRPLYYLMALYCAKINANHATSTFPVVPSAAVTTKKTIEFNDIKHAIYKTLYQLHVAQPFSVTTETLHKRMNDH